MSKTKRRVEIEDLYELVLIGEARISPEGRRIAYVRRKMDRDKNDYVSNIWLLEGEEDRQFTSGDKDGSPRWSPDGRSLAFIAKREAEGKSQLMLLRADGGEALAVTDKKWEISNIRWSPDGSRLAFVRAVPTGELGMPRDAEEDEEDDKAPGKAGKGTKQTAPTKIIERLGFKGDGLGFIHNRRRHICVIEVDSKEITQLTDGDYSDESPSWSPNGRFIAFTSNRNKDWDTEIESQIWEIPVEGGDPRRVFEDRGTWGGPIYSPDGKGLAFAGSRTDDELAVSGFARLWVCDRDGTGLTDLTGDSGLEVGNSSITDTKIEGAEGFYWNRKGIWFIATVGGASNVYRWHDGFHQVTEGLQDVRDFSVGGPSVAYTAADLLRPAELFVRRGKSPARQMTNVNADYLTTVNVVTPQPVDFEGSNGDTVHGWLMKPRELATGQKAPLILYIHGGPQAAYGNTFFHEMQVLAGRGYGILLINPHGSGAHGDEWVSSIHGDWGHRDYEDFMKATDMAASLDWVDAQRMGVGGGSYGGYMTSWIISHTSRFKVALIERALVNMVSFVGTTDVPNWWKYAWRTTIEKDATRLWKMSPLAYLKEMNTPALIIHSEQDHRCPVEQGEQIFTGLRKRGVPVRFVRFPEESHGLSRGGKPSRRVERLNEIVRWFGKHLDQPEPETP